MTILIVMNGTITVPKKNLYGTKDIDYMFVTEKFKASNRKKRNVTTKDWISPPN